MKINKFKLFSYLGLGLATIATAATVASFASPIVQVDPRVQIAGATAEISLEVLDYGGNYLWNSEVEEQNKGYLGTNFRETEFKSSLKKNKSDEWEAVEYWNLDRIK